MSRSGYSDSCDGWELIMYRGAVASAIRGKRGQQFLRDLIAALDAMPVKRLIDGKLEQAGEVCALGSVGRMRGLSMEAIDENSNENGYDYTYDGDALGKMFGIAPALARETMFQNDNDFEYSTETPEHRWERVRRWAIENLATVQP